MAGFVVVMSINMVIVLVAIYLLFFADPERYNQPVGQG